jgi:hypothetical protein
VPIQREKVNEITKARECEKIQECSIAYLGRVVELPQQFSSPAVCRRHLPGLAMLNYPTPTCLAMLS